MTVGSASLDKTPVPSTQTTVFDTGAGAAASLATKFASLKEKSELQIKAVKDGVFEAKGLACPMMVMYTAVAPDSVGGGGAAGACRQRMVCQVIVKGGFPKRLMHLLGNNKTGGGAGYPNETISACAFFSKSHKMMMHKLLMNAMDVVPKAQHEKRSWTRMDDALNRVLGIVRHVTGPNPTCLPARPDDSETRTVGDGTAAVFRKCGETAL